MPRQPPCGVGSRNNQDATLSFLLSSDWVNASYAPVHWHMQRKIGRFWPLLTLHGAIAPSQAFAINRIRCLYFWF